MAMVKASSYGAGKAEVASVLQQHHVDYLTVAYADEGVELRRNGIALPIMVMNPEEAAFDDIVRYRLEPDIYSFRILDLFARHATIYATEAFPIHLEFDTGMHRLGFGEADIEALAARFRVIGADICGLDPESADPDVLEVNSRTDRELASFLSGILSV